MKSGLRLLWAIFLSHRWLLRETHNECTSVWNDRRTWREDRWHLEVSLLTIWCLTHWAEAQIVGLYKAVLEPRVSPAFAITYLCNHCNIRFENTSKYVDTLTLFSKNLNQRSLTPRWPLTPCLLRSHVWLYPRIIVSKSHGNTSMYVDTVINFANYHIHTYTYIHTTYILRTYYVQNEWSHSLLLNSVQARQKASGMNTKLTVHNRGLTVRYFCSVDDDVIRNSSSILLKSFLGSCGSCALLNHLLHCKMKAKISFVICYVFCVLNHFILNIFKSLQIKCNIVGKPLF